MECTSAWLQDYLMFLLVPQTSKIFPKSGIRIGLIMFIESAKALVDLVDICRAAKKVSEAGSTQILTVQLFVLRRFVILWVPNFGLIPRTVMVAKKFITLSTCKLTRARLSVAP